MILTYSFDKFVPAILSGEKIHTIREDFYERWKPGMSIQHWRGNPRNVKSNPYQFAVGECKGVQDITIRLGCNCNFATDGPCRTQTTRDRFAFIRAAWIDNQFGHDGQIRSTSSLDQPSPTLTTVPKKNLVSAEFLMPTNYNNEPTDLDCQAPTVTANRKWHYLVSAKAHHYLLNQQFKSAGGSVDDPCFTLIAKMDKRPPSLVTVEPDHEDKTKTFDADNSFFQDESIDVETRVRVFMQCYGIREIYMRMLNIPELKRIQGLDMAGQQDYVLEGPKDQQKKHIGNAVEPRVVTAWIEGYYNEIKSVGKADQLKLIYA